MFTYVGRAFRWRVLISPLRSHVPVGRLISATVVGFTAVVFFGRPGELVRPWLIAVRERVPFSSQVAAWFLERIFDLLGVILLFGFALVKSGNGSHLTPRTAAIFNAGGYVALTVGLGCVGVLVLTARYSDLARRWCTAISRNAPKRLADLIIRNLEAFLDGMKSTATSGSVVKIAVYTGAEWVIICGSTFFLFKSFGPTSGLSMIDAIIFTGFVAFGSAVQLPGIGGGMQVASVLVLTEVFSLPLEKATAGAILFWAQMWLSVVPFGLLLAFREGLQWSSLRQVEQSVTVGAADAGTQFPGRP